MRFSVRKCLKLLTLLLFVLVPCITLLTDILPFTFETNFINYGGSMSKQPVEVKLRNLPSKGELHVRPQRSAMSIEPATGRQVGRHFYHSETQKNDVFISVKTTQHNHQSRLQLLIDTWISDLKNQTYIFTDVHDKNIEHQFPYGHVVNTNCSQGHLRKDLVCKMAVEFDAYIMSRKRWFCHVDDDTYLNINNLLTLLRRYNHTEDWYLGRPSLAHPIEVVDRVNPGQKIAFWFATGGAGFCISHSLAMKMIPYAGGGRLRRSSEQIRLPDDCTIGYIIESLLHKQLTVISEFQSHLQGQIGDIKSMITYGYRLPKMIVMIDGFSKEKDPTRFWTIHCRLHPFLKKCYEMQDS